MHDMKSEEEVNVNKVNEEPKASFTETNITNQTKESFVLDKKEKNQS